jgi:hypothetical protein
MSLIQKNKTETIFPLFFKFYGQILVKKGGFDHKYSKNKFKNIFFWFI